MAYDGRRARALLPGAVTLAGLVLAGLPLAGCATESLSGATDAGPTATRTAAATSRAATPTPTPPSTGRTSPTAPAVPATPALTVPDLPTPHDRGLVEGADVSWPQCPPGMGIPQKRSHGAPMPLASARFVVLGLTNGPGFHPNPCLAEQVAWVRERHLMAAAYAVVSRAEPEQLDRYGDTGPFEGRSRLGRLANVGYAQALVNLRTMREAGLDSPVVWLDVEPVPDFDWPDDPAGNEAVVRGAMQAYVAAGVRVGVYSTQALWRRIVGEARLGVQEWRAAGQTGRAEALRRCGADRMIQGGTAVLTQWVEDGRDRDVTCPGASTYLPLWFHQY